MPLLHERIDALLRRTDEVRGSIRQEITFLRSEHMVHRTEHLADVPYYLTEAYNELDQAMNDLAAAGCAAHRGGM